MEKYLKECLDSIAAQSLAEIEIICVDDGSSDGTPDILRHYQSLDSRFIVRTQENRGPGPVRNSGISAAAGEFIAFMDPDDWYPSPDILQNLYAAAKENGARICGGSFSTFSNGIVNTSYKGEYKGYTFKKAEMVNYADYQFDYGYTRFIYSRELIISNGISFPSYMRFQDPPFFVKAMCAAGQFYAVPQVTYCYRRGHQNPNWSEAKTVDSIKGMTDNLVTTEKYGLDRLHKTTFLRFSESGFLKCVYKYLDSGSEAVLCALIAANGSVNADLLRQADETDFCLIQPLRGWMAMRGEAKDKDKNKAKLHPDELNLLKNSVSYRLGRALTFVPRKVRGGFMCAKDHGVAYMLKLAVRKMRKAAN